MEIKPIETEYKGYRFRSRLEARWAVFFDECGFRWEYEPEGFDIDGTKYLPDFYLPEFSLYAEVKPNTPERLRELAKTQMLLTWGGPVNAILILSDIPFGNDGGLWYYPIMYYDSYEGVCLSKWIFHDNDDCVVGTKTLHNTKVINGKTAEGWEKENIGAKNQADMGWEPECWDKDGIVFDALTKARAARFEHGECGA